MAIPSSSEARLFYRCAYQRHEEAKVLFQAGYHTGAVYLAGYGVECILKALVIMSVTQPLREQTVKSFRGNKAHEFEWLRTVYRTNGGLGFPREINQYFTLVNSWSTDLRYTPRNVRYEESAAFLKAANAIITWADGRL